MLARRPSPAAAMGLLPNADLAPLQRSTNRRFLMTCRRCNKSHKTRFETRACFTNWWFRNEWNEKHHRHLGQGWRLIEYVHRLYDRRHPYEGIDLRGVRHLAVPRGRRGIW